MHLPHRHHAPPVSVQAAPKAESTGSKALSAVPEAQSAAPVAVSTAPEVPARTSGLPITLLPSLMYGLADWFGPDWVFPSARVIRVEDYTENGNYVLRAELPGVDPAGDIAVTIEDGILQVDAERRQETHDGRRSEFSYGAFHRCLTLPQGVDSDRVTAAYDNGILTVTVPLPKAVESAAGRAIPIQTK